MTRVARLAAVVAAVAAVAAAAAQAAPRMPIGFQDDPNFRWNSDRVAVLDKAAQSGATVIRVTVYWNRVAATRPANGANPFDPAYNFTDLDDVVRRAQADGLDVLLTLWGTPSWAAAKPNLLPKRLADFQNFARAVAYRYSGHFIGYPFVRYFSVWNEPNLNQFLAPQYDSKGRAVSPASYAKLFRSAYAGIKAGNRLALVAAGETSPRGREKPLHSAALQDTLSPGTFARLLAQQKPRIKFDAWAHHPYPSSPNLGPSAKSAWPNVVLSNLRQFETSLDTWFGRKNTPIWITEYGFQTTPPSKLKATTYAQQAAFLQQTLTTVRADPRVQMFIWFVFGDSPGSSWASGLLEQNGGAKPAYGVWTAQAPSFDPRRGEVDVHGAGNPAVKLSVPELAARSGVGSPVSVHYVVTTPRHRRLGRPADRRRGLRLRRPADRLDADRDAPVHARLRDRLQPPLRPQGRQREPRHA